ncbi:MAG: hypothetical protein R3B83_02925 [Nitrospirales bacterium]|nr:hypothetical protein [Nitrospirales bacterium]
MANGGIGWSWWELPHSFNTRSAREQLRAVGLSGYLLCDAQLEVNPQPGTGFTAEQELAARPVKDAASFSDDW